MLREIVERHGLHLPAIILGGCGRSGTTLLLAVLGSHPALHAIQDETQAFCPTAYGSRADATLPPGGSHEIDQTRLHRERMATFNAEAAFDFGRLGDSLSRAAPDPAARLLCEKTPKNVLFFRRLLDELVDVRLIHVVRDGRDVVTSVHPDRDGRYHVPPERWVDEVEIGLSVARDPRTLLVRYEDLVRQFRPSIERILDFIGLPFDDRLLDWHRHTNVRRHDSWPGLDVRPLHDSALGRWRQDRHSDVVARLLAIPRAGKLLRQLGYLD